MPRFTFRLQRLLEIGDQVTVRDYTIAVVDDGGPTHTVTVTGPGV